MGETKVSETGKIIQKDRENEFAKFIDPSVTNFFVEFPQKLHTCITTCVKRLKDGGESVDAEKSLLKQGKGLYDVGISLEDQLHAWKENPSWTDQPPVIEVIKFEQAPQCLLTGKCTERAKGSLCNLKLKVNVGLPPDAVYDIVTNPDNKRVFKNIQEVISRKVLVDEGLRQVVEVEQAALWRFLWWSGTIAVHVLVDQNREDYSMKFKQVKTGFMEKFEGSWKLEPLFVDENLCLPFKPRTWEDYHACTRGQGRIGSTVSLEQLIQPAIVPPPPISWYLRGITTRTSEMLINDLLAETARIRGVASEQSSRPELSYGTAEEHDLDEICDIKKRWSLRRKNSRRIVRK